MPQSYKRVVSTLSLAMVCAVVSPASAIVWNINPDGTGDAPTIQAAYDAASAGDVIVLAPGIYQDSNSRVLPDYFASFPETVTAVAFAKAGVDLQSTWGAGVTTIDCQSVRHGIVGLDLGTVAIRGVTIADATTSASGGGFSKWGGAILTYRSQVTIEDCRFTDCRSPAPPGGGGAAVFLAGGSGSVLRRNLFLRGYSSQLGGAIEIFQHSNVLIENNTFVDNDAADAGGAILLNATTGTVDKNIFSGNFAGGSGGAVGCISPTTVTGACNLFWMNQSPSGPNVGGCGIVVDQQNNLIGDPLFCDANAELFTINSASPANPSHPSGCGLRGAYGVACGSVSIEGTSWGQVKSHYRKD